MGADELDPKDVLQRLRSENAVFRWEPLPPDADPLSDPRPPDRSSLDYLHRNWALPDHFEPDSHLSGGARGKVLTRIGRIVFRVLGPYLGQERAVMSNLVQANQELADRCDELSRRLEALRRAFITRQAEEARNLSALALWLRIEPPNAHPESSAETTASPREGTPPRR